MRGHEAEEKAHAKAAAAEHPMVKAVLDTFPGATIADVRGVDRARAELSEDLHEGARARLLLAAERF